jgi:hypothetical protein
MRATTIKLWKGCASAACRKAERESGARRPEMLVWTSG